jgi:ribonuclease G
VSVDSVVIAAATGEVVAAFLDAGLLVRLELSRGTERGRLGEIVLGRILRVDPDLAAAFVDIGGGRTGFLNFADASRRGSRRRPLGEGDAIVVQVSREAEADKLAKLTTLIALPGRTLIFCPNRPGLRLSRRIRNEAARSRLGERTGRLPAIGGGWFVRHAAAAASAATLVAEANRLHQLWQRLEQREAAATPPARLYRPPDPVLAAIGDEAGSALTQIIADDPAVLSAVRAHCPEMAAACRLEAGPGAAFAAFAIDAQIEAALQPGVTLPGGGAIHISETPALVAIDVDVGSRRGGGGEATALATNLEAAAVLAREIRLRELAGHLVVDFVGMRRRAHRERVLASLRAAFADDRQETSVAGYTRLGKVELSRRRLRGSLRARLCAPCSACRGGGAVASPLHVAHRGLRAALRDGHGGPVAASTIAAAPAVIAALRGPGAEAVATVQRRLGYRLEMLEDPGLAADVFCLQTNGSSAT